MTSLPKKKGAIERTIRTFEDLDVWRFCRRLRNELTVLARQLPNTETFRLADQIVRAARSVKITSPRDMVGSIIKKTSSSEGKAEDRFTN